MEVFVFEGSEEQLGRLVVEVEEQPRVDLIVALDVGRVAFGAEMGFECLIQNFLELFQFFSLEGATH